MSALSSSTSLNIPPRPSNSMTGSEFVAAVMPLPLGPEREEAIFQQLSVGNMPDFMRCSRVVSAVRGGIAISLEVLPDVLCIGDDKDFVRVPMNPRTAQKLADLFDATLITPAISDLIWTQADVRINPLLVTMTPGAQMTSTKWFADQNAKIEQQRLGRSGLIAGHKKDVVVANTLALPEFRNIRVGIYGWHKLDGQPIQGLNPSPGERLTHELTYADYSHGIRLMANKLLVNNDETLFATAATDSVVCQLLNKDGVLNYLRYPTR